jgi:Outer membrane protein beta-barrel domain
MKKYLLVFTLAAFNTIITAQTTYTYTDIYGGITLPKYTYSNTGINSSRDVYQGLAIGISQSIYVAQKAVSLHGGMSYVQKGAINNTGGTNFIKAENRLNYIQGEMMLGFVAGKKNYYKNSPIDFFAGFYLGRIINGKQKLTAINSSISTVKFNIGRSAADDFKAGDFGAKFGIFVPFAKKFFISGAYEYGFTDIAPQSNIKINNRNISITAGFHLRPNRNG